MVILTEQTMEKLAEIQQTIQIVEEYSVDIKKETSCVRCSGSAGRYFYEKKKGVRK